MGVTSNHKESRPFFGGYRSFANYNAPKNIAEPCDRAENQQNKAAGFNIVATRQYCTKEKFFFSPKNLPNSLTEKELAYKWCCTYGVAIGATISGVNDSKCGKAGFKQKG